MNRADRKKQLIAQGALHRTEVVLARQATREALHPDALARTALRKLGLVALAALKRRNAPSIGGIDLEALLPLAMTGISMLAKKKALRRTLLRGAALSGAVAAIVAMLSNKKAGSPGAADERTG